MPMCFICDKEMTEKELDQNADNGHKLEPCTVCMEIIFDTAYQGNFALSDEEIVEDEDEQDLPSWVGSETPLLDEEFDDE